MDDRVQTPVAGQQPLAEVRRSDEGNAWSQSPLWAAAAAKYGSVVLSVLVIM